MCSGMRECTCGSGFAQQNVLGQGGSRIVNLLQRGKNVQRERANAALTCIVGHSVARRAVSV